MNHQIRPFTAKWHRASERGSLSALDATDEFRAELSILQEVLGRFDRLLIHLRDGRPAPDEERHGKAERQETIGAEMKREVRWGILPHMGGIDDAAQVDAINAAERAAIEARRKYYSIEEKPDAIALALSGGGIRSATFSLGVLVALSGRGLLPQFDYLSTVSGGGYLGSFLSAFLTSPVAPNGARVGLRADELPFRRDEGEAAALRHLRHHSKYLATGSLWGRTKMMSAQIYGMLLNGLGIAWIALLAVLVERMIRSSSMVEGWWKPVTSGVTTVWILGALAALLMLRFGRKLRKHADWLITVPTLLLAGLLAWRGLDLIHSWFHNFSLNSQASWLWRKENWLVITGAIPLIASAFTGVFGRFLKRLGVILIALSAIAAPLFFFGIYLVIYEWAGREGAFVLGKLTEWEIIAFGTVVYFVFLDINFTSPHRHYRNKLAEAYLIRPAQKPSRQKPFDKAVSIRLSHLGKSPSRAPYHLINCALNVPGSSDPRMQGRLADFFLFSPRYCGSPLTGYEETESWEKADAHLGLGTAMAISAAAAAPQMGLGTMKRLSFWLALLNVRLGYWVRKPGKHALFFGGAPGLWFLLKEMLGTMNEKSAWLNVSDGGHIENLGVYELLRRRCKYIVAIDGEQDPKMTFHALTTLQRLAFIDFGVRIDVDLDDLRLNDRGLSRSHFRFCRIRYPKDGRGSEEVCGYLLYLKLSLTGNEGEFIRRYRFDEPIFPHHSTADQFFSETQFEAYRSLGEHVGDKLFLRALAGDELATTKSVKVEEWFRALGENLLDPLPQSAQTSGDNAEHKPEQ
ncbi:MAG TPA: patatin-like phospholipase family protein [Chthoniobacterales bacterium]|nr:patatin-like phospholipase family protein [Chthoniobacterales bacterium]